MNGLYALAAAGSCAALGMSAARRLTRREALLTAWDGALLRMEGAVTHSGMGLTDVLRQGMGEGNAALEELIRRLSRTPAAAPEALSKQEVKEILTNAVSKAPALDALFPGLAQRPAQRLRCQGVDRGMAVQGFLGI